MQIIDARRLRPPDEIIGRTRALLSPFLLPLSAVYGAGVWVWRRLPAQTGNPGVPVISVGGISVGGTGKTPMSIYVARRFAALVPRVCIISRGYRRKGIRSPLLVSDGETVFTTVKEAGDEPFLMAMRLPQVGVIVSRDRFQAAMEAVGRIDTDLIVLDDGFQCRNIVKHLEIVCLDHSCLDSKAALVPRGILREQKSSIRPDHLVVIILRGGERRPDPEEVTGLGSAHIFFAAHKTECIAWASKQTVEPGESQVLKVLLLSGIARPSAFEASALAAGLRAPVSIRFDDHHWYSSADESRIRQMMDGYGCTHVVTTEKDVYKLSPELRQKSLVLMTDLDIENAERFWQVVDSTLRGNACLQKNQIS